MTKDDKLSAFYRIIDSKETHPKIQEGIKEFIFNHDIDFSFFGNFLLGVEFYKSTKLPMKTMAVTVNSIGACLLWHPEFVEEQDQSVINGLLVHELFHLILNHVSRTKRGDYDNLTSNIVQDMIINSTIKEQFFNNGIISMSLPTNENNEELAYFIPNEYTGKRTFEELYDWYVENNPIKDNDDRENIQGEECSEEGKRLIDDHLDIPSDISEEAQQHYVDSVVEGAKNMGKLGGNMEKLLNDLKKPSKNWFKAFKSELNKMKGNSVYMTYSKLHRRNIEGLRGKKLLSKNVVILLDTSASMTGEFEKVLSEINSKNINIILIPCDTRVIEDSIVKINSKRKLKSYKINGLGGTDLQPAIDFVKNSKKYKTNEIIILTDGFAPSINLDGFKRTLVITTGIKISVSSFTGIVEQFTIDDN